jgi:hypothetical protein
LLQRDDGKIRDAYVEPYNLSAACKAFVLATRWTAAGKWITAHAYAVNDLVDVSGAAYICVTAHTSGVFATDYAASKWQIFTAASTAGGTSFTPVSTISATDVQSAIVEVNDESRATSLPMLAAFYGAY